jgi:hypothetical protein
MNSETCHCFYRWSILYPDTSCFTYFFFGVVHAQNEPLSLNTRLILDWKTITILYKQPINYQFPFENYSYEKETINDCSLSIAVSRWRDILKYLFYRKEKFTMKFDISQLVKLWSFLEIIHKLEKIWIFETKNFCKEKYVTWQVMPGHTHFFVKFHVFEKKKMHIFASQFRAIYPKLHNFTIINMTSI